MSKRHENHENHDRWLVSYADFITLLFAFFVVLFATSTANTDKQKNFEASVRQHLKLEGGHTDKQVPDAGAIIAEYIQGTNPEGYPQKGGASEAADFATRYLNQKMSGDEKKSTELEVRRDVGGVRISMSAAAFFPEGEYKLKRSSLKALNDVADLLKMTDRKILVEGHTDDQPIHREGISSNWELGSLRATSIVRYLIKYQSLDPKRMAAISYADQKPLVPNDSAENRAKNRRIEILMVTSGGETEK